MKKKIRFPGSGGKKPPPLPPIERRNIGISMTTEWNLDAFIEECETLLQVCKRIRDRRHHNRRCCLNCQSLDTIRTFVCDKCGLKVVETPTEKFKIGEACPGIKTGDDKSMNRCEGKLKLAGVPERRLCVNPKVVALMENPMEFDVDSDIRIFVCPFFGFRQEVTKNVKSEDPGK